MADFLNLLYDKVEVYFEVIGIDATVQAVIGENVGIILQEGGKQNVSIYGRLYDRYRNGG